MLTKPLIHSVQNATADQTKTYLSNSYQQEAFFEDFRRPVLAPGL